MGTLFTGGEHQRRGGDTDTHSGEVPQHRPPREAAWRLIHRGVGQAGRWVCPHRVWATGAAAELW